MAIKGTAGDVFFYLFNTNRTHSNPPIVFADYDTINPFSFSIWVKVTEAIPNNLWVYQGIDGSYVALIHDGIVWKLVTRDASTAGNASFAGPTTLNKWTLFYFTVVPPGVIKLYRADEPDVSGITPLGSPVVNTTFAKFFRFERFTFTASAGMSICNLKYWKTVNTITEAQNQVNTWNPVSGPGPVAPMWCSTLRTPGDLSNIATVAVNSFYWDEDHAYTLIQQADSLIYVADPQYLNTQPCTTFLYPYELNLPTANPGLTPIVPTTYKGVIFNRFEDRGSVPITPFQGIAYLGIASTVVIGVGPSDTYGLFLDEDLVEVPITLGPSYRFETSTITAIPPPIDPITMYLWRFGAQFTWQPHTPQVATVAGYLSVIHLLVTYIGVPTGIPTLPPDLVGLFAVNKGGKSVDRYNSGVELKIPNPTIRTAYIGE